MTDKEFRRLRRGDLIEIIYDLQKEQLRLKRENADLQYQLSQRAICLNESGSIAEAALRLNHIFESAQAAADQYLASLRTVHTADTREAAL